MPGVNVFRAESRVPPPVKSWLQTDDEKPFYCPPACSISLQRNKMVMAYKTPVERLKRELVCGNIQHRSLRLTPTKKRFMVVDSYKPTMANTARKHAQTHMGIVWK